MAHTQLPDAGQLSHFLIDDALGKLQKAIENAPLDITGVQENPTAALADLLTSLATLGLITDSSTSSPEDVTGARDTPEEALANLLTALETLGLITDSTTAS